MCETGIDNVFLGDVFMGDFFIGYTHVLQKETQHIYVKYLSPHHTCTALKT